MDGLTIKTAKNLLKTADLAAQKNSVQRVSNKEQGGDFGTLLKDAVNKVNDLQKTADVKMQQLATGQTTDISSVKIAAEKADISLRLMTSVRNKVVDAYQEIMKMQV